MTIRWTWTICSRNRVVRKKKSDLLHLQHKKLPEGLLTNIKSRDEKKHKQEAAYLEI